MKKSLIIASILILIVITALVLFSLNKNAVTIVDVNCVREGKESYGEAPVVHQCCADLKMIGAIDDKGNATMDVAYCTKCGNGECKKPENKYNCPEDCK